MATMQKHVRSIDELAEAVYQCISTEHNSSEDAHSAALPEHQRGQRTSHELDVASFANAVGVAYGIARGEDPFEPSESVAERAGAAATIAFERWGHWDVTYEQDRAARPVPIVYPGAKHVDRATPWEPIEDVSNALDKIEAVVGAGDRERLQTMYRDLQDMAARVYREHQAAATSPIETVA
jgi:hypothetical protein